MKEKEKKSQSDIHNLFLDDLLRDPLTPTKWCKISLVSSFTS